MNSFSSLLEGWNLECAKLKLTIMNGHNSAHKSNIKYVLVESISDTWQHNITTFMYVPMFAMIHYHGENNEFLGYVFPFWPSSMVEYSKLDTIVKIVWETNSWSFKELWESNNGRLSRGCTKLIKLMLKGGFDIRSYG